MSAETRRIALDRRATCGSGCAGLPRPLFQAVRSQRYARHRTTAQPDA